MHKLGNILAFITNKIFILLLISLVLIFVQVIAVTSVITSRDKVKNILSTADIYTTLPQNAIYLISLPDDEETVAEDVDVTVVDEERITAKTIAEVLEENGFIEPVDVTKTITVVITPEFLRAQTEGVINGAYGYLEGETKDLEFTLTLKDRANTAKTEIATLINAKLASIPVCTDAEQMMQPEDFNILEATCLPIGVSLQAEVDSFVDELTNSEGVFSEEFTQKDVELSDADAGLSRLVYDGARAIPWVFWILLISFSIVIIVTAKTLHRGFKMVGIIGVVSGLILLVLYGLFVKNFDFLNESIMSDTGDMGLQQVQAINNVAGPLLNALTQQITSGVLLYSLIIIVGGVACYIVGIYTTRHNIEHLYIPGHAPKISQDDKTVNSKPESGIDNIATTETNDAADIKEDPGTTKD